MHPEVQQNFLHCQPHISGGPFPHACAAKRVGRSVALSVNLPGNQPLMRAFAEKRLLQELQQLQLVSLEVGEEVFLRRVLLAVQGAACCSSCTPHCASLLMTAGAAGRRPEFVSPAVGSDQHDLTVACCNLGSHGCLKRNVSRELRQAAKHSTSVGGPQRARHRPPACRAAQALEAVLLSDAACCVA